MRRTAFALAALLLAGPALAADSIGGANEKPVELEGKVVDLVCELTGKCLPGCGAGRRQMGLLLANGRLVAVPKAPVDFAGAALDLAPLCGRTIRTDGLMFENPKMPVYQVQGIKADPAATAFALPDAFIRAWTAKNGPHDEWMRADPAVRAQIGRTGPLGRSDLKPKPQ